MVGLSGLRLRRAGSGCIAVSLAGRSGDRRSGSAGYAESMANEPGEPREGDPRREGGLATATRKKVQRPPKYKVVLYNDDYTPMEFVVTILEKIFGKGPSEATAIMLAIHKGGIICSR